MMFQILLVRRAIPWRAARLAQWLLVATLAGAMATASAMSIREFRALEKTEEQGTLHAQYYLTGLLEGSLEVNDTLLRQGGKPLFCLNGRRLESSMALSLYRTELSRNVEIYEADMPVQFVLLNALTTVYTC